MKDNLESDKIIQGFLDDLKEKGISNMSISNYKSDLNSFESWLARKLKSLGIFTENLSEAIAFISPQSGSEYKKHLIDSSTINSSLNRRLSTLRRLSKFLFDKGYLDFDFMGEIKNISSSSPPKALDVEGLTLEFRKFLEDQKVSKNTIKNYLSDIKHFINWFNQNGLGEPHG